jgi:hypothetical protein
MRCTGRLPVLREAAHGHAERLAAVLNPPAMQCIGAAGCHPHDGRACARCLLCYCACKASKTFLQCVGDTNVWLPRSRCRSTLHTSACVYTVALYAYMHGETVLQCVKAPAASATKLGHMHVTTSSQVT